MSTEQVSISKPQAPRLSVDYDALYAKGIEYIESLSSQLWTDYNSHDPGITTLEILCYAITELGYRCDFAIGDIIEPDPALTDLKQEFFTLSEVASNAPLSINDFRKYLIDLPGIRNAWLERILEPEPKLYLGGTVDDPQLVYGSGSTEVDIKGLYDVFVRFDEDPEFGDLNDNSFNAFFELTLVGEAEDGGPNTVRFEAEIEFPLFEEIESEIDHLIDLDGKYVSELVDGEIKENTDESNVFEFTLDINPDNRHFTLDMTMRVVSGMERVLNYNDFKNKLTASLSDPDNRTLPPVPGSETWLVTLLNKFLGRRKRIRTLLDEVRRRLAERRNLCEDFESIYPMGLKEIGLELDLVVTPGSNLDEILAQVYEKAEIYLSPPISFYSLREMLDKGYRPEEIFRGPVLQNGFLDENDLSFLSRRSVLYTSDLIQEFMKIEGVEKVDHIALYCYEQGRLADPIGATECLRLKNPERSLPRLNHTRSAIRMDDASGKWKTPDRLAALERLAEANAIRALKGAPGREGFAIPEGTFRGLEEYYSLQHEFPINYAIGEEGLAPNEPDLRKAQAAQFKAYLLFFEQLLANFLSQISNIRRLYSYWDESRQTYFTQALFDVPRVQNLIADFTDAGNPNPLWEDYKAAVDSDPTHYANRMDAFAEDLFTFQDRRKRFLDHLIARFNESFTEYAAYTFSNEFPEFEQYETLIADQERFLQHYAEHSHDRGTAFNYQILLDGLFGTEFWNSDRVTGLKKRMTYLMGLPKVEREYISPFHEFEIFSNTPGQFRFRLFDEGGTQQLLQMPSSLGSREAVVLRLGKVLSLGQEEANYIKNGSNIDLVETLPDNSTVTLARLTASLRNNSPDDTTAIKTVVSRLEQIWVDALFRENFHVIEHVLLRPRQSGEPTMALRKVLGCSEHDIIDPYSFRISVVLPAWAGRFDEIDFRRLFKKVMRMEVPAHVYIHFYWVDTVQMYHFEKCWEDWLNGEWILGMHKLLQETEDELEQENRYDLLLEKQTNAGEDGIYFVDCMAQLKNLRDAYYTLEPPRIVDQYEKCDLLASPVDPDGEIIRAWLPEDAPALPPGTCLDACSGEIRVSDPDALEDVEAGYPLEIMTLSSTGETTYHSITIEFIPNGPATIVFGPLNQHIAKYNLNDVVVRLEEDPDDGPIIQADLIAGSLPAGMELRLDAPFAVVEVVDESLLVPGTYYGKVYTMDNEGGETELEFTIEILPDTPPQAVRVNMLDNKSEDAYVQGDVLLKVTDIDEGVANLAVRPPLNALADIGLSHQLNAAVPPEAEIVISDLAQFKAALVSYFNYSAGFYEYDLPLRVVDGCTAVVDILPKLRIRQDTLPTITAVSPRNIDTYDDGEVLVTIKDPVDLGIETATTAANLAAEGMRLEVVAKQARIVVDNEIVFRDAAANSFVTTTAGLKRRKITVNTRDMTGGLATRDVFVTVRPDVEATVTIAPPRNQDQYDLGDLLATFEDVDGNGIVFLKLSSAQSTSLPALGMQVSIVPGNQPGRSKGELRVNNLSFFRGALSDPSLYSPVPNSNDLVSIVLEMESLDETGGKSTTPTEIIVRRDFDGVMEEVFNGMRVDEYSAGTVLFRFPFTDPNGPLAYQTPNLSSAPNLGWRQGATGWEIYVQVPYSSGPGGLRPLNLSLNINAQDITGGLTTFNPTITIRPRLLTFSRVLPTKGVSATIELGFSAFTHSITPSTGYSGFGRLYGGYTMVFYKYSGFSSSLSGRVFTFNGIIPGPSPEPFEGEITISPEIFVAAPVGTLDSGSIASRLALGTLDVAGASSGEKTQELARKTVEVVQEIDRARAYDDNPLLITNPKLIAEYATGKKDGEVAVQLEALTKETSDEINRLQQVIRNSSGQKQADARNDLVIYNDLYARQVMTASSYASEVRVDDVPDDGPVKDLFKSISNQISRMK